ncbi:hypothetical protein TRIP_B50246 [uncultured Desulfatiglans sp.]|nr:hypothetical protein TRIP_B50246 [uncultured Desulfatiglans sp.]
MLTGSVLPGFSDGPAAEWMDVFEILEMREGCRGSDSSSGAGFMQEARYGFPEREVG